MRRFLHPYKSVFPQILLGFFAIGYIFMQLPVEKPDKVANELLNDWRERLVVMELVILPIAILFCLYNRKSGLIAWTVICILFIAGAIQCFNYRNNVNKDCICNCADGYKTRIGREFQIPVDVTSNCAELIEGKSCNTYDEILGKEIWTPESIKECENDIFTSFALTNLFTSVSAIFLLQVIFVKIRPPFECEIYRKKNFYHGRFNLVRRIKNIVKTKGYSFKISGLQKTDGLLIPGMDTTISGSIRNNGILTGTVYVVIRVTNAYDHAINYLDSNIALTQNVKESLRLVDIKILKEGRFSFNWVPHEDIRPGPLSISVEVWTPGKLYEKDVKYPGSIYLFDHSPWLGYAVLLNKNEFEGVEVFISYSMHNEKHSLWVWKLYEQLLRYNIKATFNQKDVGGGEDFHKFMANSIDKSKIFLLICSSEFVKKANEKLGAVGIEVSLMLEKFPGDRSKNFIPIYCDNAEKKLPDDFKTLHAINMEGEECFSLPLSDLVIGIKNKKALAEKQNV